MANLVQCNICQKWFASRHGLLIHLRFCCENHARLQNDPNHNISEHHPLKSSYDKDDHLNPFNVYDNLEDYSSVENQEIDCEHNQDGVHLDIFSDEDDINIHDKGSDDDGILKCNDND